MKGKKLSVILTLLFFVGCASNPKPTTVETNAVVPTPAPQPVVQTIPTKSVCKIKKGKTECQEITLRLFNLDNGDQVRCEVKGNDINTENCFDKTEKKISLKKGTSLYPVVSQPAPSQQPAQSQVAQPQGQMQLSEENLAGGGKSLACKVNGIQVQCPPELLQKYTEQQQSGQGFDLNGLLNGGLNVLQKGGQILNTFRYY